MTDVRGCGPKLGLSLLSELGEERIAGAIIANDAKALAGPNRLPPKPALTLGINARLAWMRLRNLGEA